MLWYAEYVLNWARNQKHIVYTTTNIIVVVPGSSMVEESSMRPVVIMEIRPAVQGSTISGVKINKAKGQKWRV